MAVPRRGRLLGAKAVVVGAVALAVGLVMAFASFLLGQALISGQAPTAALSDPGVARAVLGVGLYGAAVGLLGMALGALLRSTAAAVATLVAAIWILPAVFLAPALRRPGPAEQVLADQRRWPDHHRGARPRDARPVGRPRSHARHGCSPRLCRTRAADPHRRVKAPAGRSDRPAGNSAISPITGYRPRSTGTQRGQA